MTAELPVTRWLETLQQGDREVIQELWQAFFPKLVRLASNRLRGMPPHLVAAEELAHSAFKSFCLAAEKRRFPKLADRDDLWQVLVRLVRNKAATAWEFHTRDKRDFNRIEEDALALRADDSDDVKFIKQMLRSKEPDPAFAAEVAEQCDWLLKLLPDDELRQIVLLKMEGYTNQEIADQLGVAPITIERRLNLIRKSWLSYEMRSDSTKSATPSEG